MNANDESARTRTAQAYGRLERGELQGRAVVTL
jgi:hypothetical protein